MSSEDYVYSLRLTQEEADALSDGDEVHFDIPGQFIEKDPTIAVFVDE